MPVRESSEAAAAPAILAEADWRARQRAHKERVGRWTEPHRARGARGEKHPVLDFLWDYYSLRPALLERWHPGIGVALASDGAREFLRRSGYVETDAGVTVTRAAFSDGRIESVRWVRDLLRVRRTAGVLRVFRPA